MADRVTIDARYRGPAESGNGGYSCGVLARALDPLRAEVTLRLPPPLDRPLDVETAGGVAVMRDGDAVVAEAIGIDDFVLDVPAPVGLDQAAAARDSSPMQHDHPYPECFVCGPARGARDGLRVTCGPIGESVVASPWRVDESILDDSGEVPPEIVWSVLDCPGGIAGMLMPDLGVSVLGRLAVRIHRPVEPGSTCVAMGWPIDREGRKFLAGSAVFSAEGDLLADARATWIELKS